MAGAAGSGARPWPVIIGAIAYGVLGVLSLMPALLSVMMFDAPGSEDNPLTVALVAGLLATPLILFLSTALLVVRLAWQSRRAMLVGLWLPILPALYIPAVILALQRVCGGTFVCK